jgi:hypothetical protein
VVMQELFHEKRKISSTPVSPGRIPNGLWSMPYFQSAFRRLLLRVAISLPSWPSHNVSAVWLGRPCMRGAIYRARLRTDPKAKNKRARMLARALRKLGYEDWRRSTMQRYSAGPVPS